MKVEYRGSNCGKFFKQIVKHKKCLQVLHCMTKETKGFEALVKEITKLAQVNIHSFFLLFTIFWGFYITKILTQFLFIYKYLGYSNMLSHYVINKYKHLTILVSEHRAHEYEPGNRICKKYYYRKRKYFERTSIGIKKYIHEISLEFDDKKVLNSTNLVTSYLVSGILIHLFHGSYL